MRGALKKPSENISTRIQNLAPGLNPQREIRAKKITKHGRVQHFGHPTPKNTAASPRPVLQGELMNTKPVAQSVSKSGSQTVALPSMITSASHQKIERMLDAALAQADAHKESLKYHAARHFWQRPAFLGKKHRLKLGLICLVVVFGILITAWEKLPILSVKLAAARTHVNASIPSYQPQGYQISAPAKISSGAVVIAFKSQVAGSGYEITEQSSNLTSSNIAQSAVPQGAQVQTSHVDGNTVYIFGQNNDATWVNNGVMYTIKDHSKLSSDQIIKIVHSLN